MVVTQVQQRMSTICTIYNVCITQAKSRCLNWSHSNLHVCGPEPNFAYKYFHLLEEINKYGAKQDGKGSTKNNEKKLQTLCELYGGLANVFFANQTEKMDVFWMVRFFTPKSGQNFCEIRGGGNWIGKYKILQNIYKKILKFKILIE